jgi:hypothetical protein
MAIAKRLRRQRDSCCLISGIGNPACNRRGYGEGMRADAPLDPLGGTSYLPGTEAKIRIMSNRASRGVQLHHPDDAKWTDAPVELAGELQPSHQSGPRCYAHGNV